MSKPLSNDAVSKALKGLPGWALKDNAIHKAYKFEHFQEAFSFLTRVAFAAEEAGHHPEIRNVYNRVELTLTTHDAGDKVTQKDLDLAGRIEAFNWL